MVEVRGVDPLTLYLNDIRINHYMYEREGFEPSLRLVSRGEVSLARMEQAMRSFAYLR